MKNKNLISLTVAFAFLAMALTGILMYIKQKSHPIEITHTIFGLLFIGFAIFHILNNWSSIIGYSKERRSGKIQKELIVAASIFGVVLVGGLTELLEPVAEAGRFLAGKRPPRPEKLSFDPIATQKDVKGTDLTLMVEKGKEAELPIIAIWVEDSTHKFVENLLVPAQVASLPKDPAQAQEAREEHRFENTPFVPASLPTWNSKATVKTPNFDKTSPQENFVLKTHTTAKNKFFVMIEIGVANKTEVYESAVDLNKSTIFKLSGKDNTLIANGLVEIK